MNKVKILFILPSLSGGGAEKVISIIIKYLNRKHFTPILLLVANVNKTDAFYKNIPEDVEVISLENSRARYSLIKIYLLIKKYKPHIVFSTLGYLNLLVSFLISLFKNKTVFIAREANTVSIINKETNNTNIFNFLYKVLYPKFDHIICQCDFMRNDLISNYNIQKNKIVVINNPVEINDGADFHKNRDSGLYDRSKINLLAIGRLTYQKGFDLLLKTVTFLGPEYFLTILGEGPLYGELVNLSKELGLTNRIRFMGFIKNPESFIAQADLFVLSSRYEGFPNVVLEATLLGLPVVAFKSPGGIVEIIENGINGWLVEFGNIKEFSTTIEKAINAKLPPEEIHLKTMMKFNHTKIISEYEQLFKKSISIKFKKTFNF